MDYRMNSVGHPSPILSRNSVADKSEGPVLAMAYVLMQELECVYEPETAFHKGTLFPELDLPFSRTRGCCSHG